LIVAFKAPGLIDMNNMNDSDNKNSKKDIKAFKNALDRFIGQ